MMTDDTTVIVVVGAADGAPIKHPFRNSRTEKNRSEVRNNSKIKYILPIAHTYVLESMHTIISIAYCEYE